MRAAITADAQCDHHDGVLSGVSLRAAEGDECGPGVLRAAAVSIRTRSTQQRPVEPNAVAAVMLEADWYDRAVTALTHTRLLELRIP